VRKQTQYLIAALLLVVVLSAAFVVSTRRPAASPAPIPQAEAVPTPMPPGPREQRQPSSPADLVPLGVTGRPSATEPQGLQITGFVPADKPWPLEVIGVEEGDVIITCNGQREQMARRLQAAVEALQERGEPIVLEVLRGGERIVLERTERLPDG